MEMIGYNKYLWLATNHTYDSIKLVPVIGYNTYIWLATTGA